MDFVAKFLYVPTVVDVRDGHAFVGRVNPEALIQEAAEDRPVVGCICYPLGSYDPDWALRMDEEEARLVQEMVSLPGDRRSTAMSMWPEALKAAYLSAASTTAHMFVDTLSEILESAGTLLQHPHPRWCDRRPVEPRGHLYICGEDHDGPDLHSNDWFTAAQSTMPSVAVEMGVLPEGRFTLDVHAENLPGS